MKNLFKIILPFIFLGISFCACSQQPENSTENKSKSELYKQYFLETDKSPANETWINNLYRNTKYKFRVEFPVGWEYSAGASKNILCKAINRVYGITISVTVIQYGVKAPYPNDIYKGITLEDFQKDMEAQLAKQNVKISQIKISKGFVNNFNAYIYECTTTNKSVQMELEYYSKQFQTIANNTLYTITINLPVDFHNEETDLIFNRVVDSFKFEFVD